MTKKKKKKGLGERVEAWGKKRMAKPKLFKKKKTSKRLTIKLADL